MKKIYALMLGLMLSLNLLVVAPAGAQTITEGELWGGKGAGATTKGAIVGAAGLSDTDVRITIANIIRVAMGLLGIVTVVIILYGGFLWMTAGGNDEQVGEAKKWITSGVIGLAIILSAYALADFIIKSLVTATTTPAATTPAAI